MKLEKEAKKLVSSRFHIFRKKASERMPMRKMWDYAIDINEGFLLRKKKIYLLLREKREEIYEFIDEQLRKGYIRPSNLSQIALVFFVGKRNSKKQIVQYYRYLNE